MLVLYVNLSKQEKCHAATENVCEGSQSFYEPKKSHVIHSACANSVMLVALAAEIILLQFSFLSKKWNKTPIIV